MNCQGLLSHLHYYYLLTLVEFLLLYLIFFLLICLLLGHFLLHFLFFSFSSSFHFLAWSSSRSLMHSLLRHTKSVPSLQLNAHIGLCSPLVHIYIDAGRLLLPKLDHGRNLLPKCRGEDYLCCCLYQVCFGDPCLGNLIGVKYLDWIDCQSLLMIGAWRSISMLVSSLSQIVIIKIPLALLLQSFLFYLSFMLHQFLGSYCHCGCHSCQQGLIGTYLAG